MPNAEYGFRWIDIPSYSVRMLSFEETRLKEMSLKIIKEEVDIGSLTIQLDNGDYIALKQVVDKWKFKDRETALRFALAVIVGTENGTLSKKEENGSHSILIPTDEVLEKKDNASKK